MYLDTNVVVWLAGAPAELSDSARDHIRRADRLMYSPMVELELEYLFEIGRLRHNAATLLSHIRTALDLRACDKPFPSVVEVAKRMRWTRDPFDRVITAQAALDGTSLLTRDKIILANYTHAIW